MVARPSQLVDSVTLTGFLTQFVDPASLLITDQFKSYNRMRDFMRHARVDHSCAVCRWACSHQYD